MRVHVLLFGPLADVYGAREEWLELGPSPTAADVHLHYRDRDPRIGELRRSLHIAVNQAVVAATHPLAPSDEVALLPPVCGGAPDSSDLDPDLIDLIDTPLEDHPWRKHLGASAEDFGAVASFEGLVRKDDQDDRTDPVTALAFDAYRPMAITALHEIAADARRRWPIQGLVMLHRLGTVPAGEICVVTAVAAGHREEAFAACKFLIDTLKAAVPIWKKEITASSERWVEGVPLLPTSTKVSS